MDVHSFHKTHATASLLEIIYSWRLTLNPHHEDSDWKQIEIFTYVIYLVSLLITTYVTRWQMIGSIFPRNNEIAVFLIFSLETLMMNKIKSLFARYKLSN